MTLDARTARIAAHEANLKRYAWLLMTQLTDLERTFINKRIAEERLALAKLSSSFAADLIAPHVAAAQSAADAAHIAE